MNLKLTCVTFLCFLLPAVVTGATSGIGKAYASEVSLHFPFTIISHNPLGQISSLELRTVG